MLIEQIIKTKGGRVFTIASGQTLSQAADMLDRERIGAVVALDADGGVAGVLSERDIVRHLARAGASALDMSVEEAMTRGVITAAPNESLDTCLSRMTDRRIRHLPVIVDGALTGLVSIGDLVKWKIEATQAEADAMAEYIKGA